MKPRYDESPLLAKAVELEQRIDRLIKTQPGFEPEKITDVNPHFVAESGGQTKSGYFTTNGKTIQTEDAKPKKKKADKKTDLARLGDKMNPHSGTGVEREDSAGEGSSQ